VDEASLEVRPVAGPPTERPDAKQVPPPPAVLAAADAAGNKEKWRAQGDAAQDDAGSRRPAAVSFSPASPLPEAEGSPQSLKPVVEEASCLACGGHGCSMCKKKEDAT